MKTRILFLTIAFLTTPLILGDVSQIPSSQDDTTRQAAVALFEKSCMSCHQIPDTRFAVDRAWLTQVKDTA